MNIKVEKEFLHAIYNLLYGDYNDSEDEVIFWWINQLLCTVLKGGLQRLLRIGSAHNNGGGAPWFKNYPNFSCFEFFWT